LSFILEGALQLVTPEVPEILKGMGQGREDWGGQPQLRRQQRQQRRHCLLTVVGGCRDYLPLHCCGDYDLVAWLIFLYKIV
jgi:hypothetical protein